MKNSESTQQRPIDVFFVSWNRPLYLWACLDSFFRGTRYPHRFILVDNGSSDPLVRKVVEGFSRRGMLDTVIWCDENLPERFSWIVREYADSLTDCFVTVDTDTVVEWSTPCWLERFVALMDADESLGTLGSLIDSKDFVDLESAAGIEPEFGEADLRALIKADSPERRLEDQYSEPIIDPFNPPGRLAILRTEALRALRASGDHKVYLDLKSAGYSAGIATTVRHRHLSLLNIFDYSDYDVRGRDRFFSSYKGGTIRVPEKR